MTEFGSEIYWDWGLGKNETFLVVGANNRLEYLYLCEDDLEYCSREEWVERQFNKRVGTIEDTPPGGAYIEKLEQLTGAIEQEADHIFNSPIVEIENYALGYLACKGQLELEDSIRL